MDIIKQKKTVVIGTPQSKSPNRIQLSRQSPNHQTHDVNSGTVIKNKSTVSNNESTNNRYKTR